MFSHSQHAGTCILLCTLPHSALTLSITLPSYMHIMLIMIIMMQVHTHPHTHTHAHTHAHTCMRALTHMHTHNSCDQYNFYRVSDYHSTSAKNEQLLWWVVNGTCVHDFYYDPVCRSCLDDSDDICSLNWRKNVSPGIPDCLFGHSVDFLFPCVFVFVFSLFLLFLFFFIFCLFLFWSDWPAGPDLILFTARHSCCRDKRVSGTRILEKERDRLID